MAQRFEPVARDLVAVGWTTRSLGLPFVTAKSTPRHVVAALKDEMAGVCEEQRDRLVDPRQF
jgi:hypothetical protein